MESFLMSHESNLPLPPASGEDTIFEFVVDDKGQWEHWNNRVCTTLHSTVFMYASTLLTPLMWKCFGACWLVGLSLCQQDYSKIVDECSLKFLEGLLYQVPGLGTWNRSFTFWGNLLSDLDPRILFLLCLFAICKITQLYCCLLGVSIECR